MFDFVVACAAIFFFLFLMNLGPNHCQHPVTVNRNNEIPIIDVYINLMGSPSVLKYRSRNEPSCISSKKSDLR